MYSLSFSSDNATIKSVAVSLGFNIDYFNPAHLTPLSKTQAVFAPRPAPCPEREDHFMVAPLGVKHEIKVAYQFTTTDGQTFECGYARMRRNNAQPLDLSSQAEFNEKYSNSEGTNIYGWNGEVPSPGYYRQGGTLIHIFKAPVNGVIGTAV